MSAIVMVFCVILVLSSITFLSRQNLRRISRQRKLEAVLAKVKQERNKV